jgi:hypothetical protein
MNIHIPRGRHNWLTLIKGASASFANLLAISVFPHPVGPIIRIFLGTISSLNSGDTRCLRHLFPVSCRIIKEITHYIGKINFSMNFYTFTEG